MNLEEITHLQIYRPRKFRSDAFLFWSCGPDGYRKNGRKRAVVWPWLVLELCKVLALTQLGIQQSDWWRAGIRSTNLHIVVKLLITTSPSSLSLLITSQSSLSLLITSPSAIIRQQNILTWNRYRFIINMSVLWSVHRLTNPVVCVELPSWLHVALAEITYGLGRSQPTCTSLLIRGRYVFLTPKLIVSQSGIQDFWRYVFLFINSLWPSDAIWRHKSRSTLAQVMACCLTAPSHYLNQCWLIISKVQWHPSESNFTTDTSAISH